jgi:hypothetical protein
MGVRCIKDSLQAQTSVHAGNGSEMRRAGMFERSVVAGDVDDRKDNAPHQRA